MYPATWLIWQVALHVSAVAVFSFMVIGAIILELRRRYREVFPKREPEDEEWLS